MSGCIHSTTFYAKNFNLILMNFVSSFSFYENGSKGHSHIISWQCRDKHFSNKLFKHKCSISPWHYASLVHNSCFFSAHRLLLHVSRHSHAGLSFHFLIFLSPWSKHKIMHCMAMDWDNNTQPFQLQLSLSLVHFPQLYLYLMELCMGKLISVGSWSWNAFIQKKYHCRPHHHHHHCIVSTFSLPPFTVNCLPGWWSSCIISQFLSLITHNLEHVLPPFSNKNFCPIPPLSFQ